MPAGYRRNHGPGQKRLFQDPRPVVGVPAPTTKRTTDYLEAPDLTLRLKSMVKPRASGD